MKITMSITKKGGKRSSVNRAYRSTTNKAIKDALRRVAYEYKEHMIHMHDTGKNIIGKPLIDNKNGEEYSFKYMTFKKRYKGWTHGIDLNLTGNMRKNMTFHYNIFKGSNKRGASLEIILPPPRPVRYINVFRKVNIPVLKAKTGYNEMRGLTSSKSYKQALKKKGETFRMNKYLREKLFNAIKKKGGFQFFDINF